jgi:hypothetical protein
MHWKREGARLGPMIQGFPDGANRNEVAGDGLAGAPGPDEIESRAPTAEEIAALDEW